VAKGLLSKRCRRFEFNPEKISYLPEEAGAYRNLKGTKYLRFMANFYASTGDVSFLPLLPPKRTAFLRAKVKYGDRLFSLKTGCPRLLAAHQ